MAPGGASPMFPLRTSLCNAQCGKTVANLWLFWGKDFRSEIKIQVLVVYFRDLHTPRK